jgi:hypothetical protein
VSAPMQDFPRRRSQNKKEPLRGRSRDDSRAAPKLALNHGLIWLMFRYSLGQLSGVHQARVNRHLATSQ